MDLEEQASNQMNLDMDWKQDPNTNLDLKQKTLEQHETSGTFLGPHAETKNDRDTILDLTSKTKQSTTEANNHNSGPGINQ